MEALRALVSHSSSIANASPEFEAKYSNTGRLRDSSTVSAETGKDLLIQTKYGLCITITDSLSVHSIKLISPTTSIIPDPPILPDLAPSSPPSSFRYRLFSDYNASYLSYDTTWPHNPQYQHAVGPEVIESRYRSLYSYYEAWEELHEVEFEKQKCHLGERGPVFEDRKIGYAWLLEGLLMACWLAMQNGVDQVVYEPGRIGYVLRDGESDRGSEGKEDEMEVVGSIERVFEKFLKDISKRY
jgi:hypothetical protein